MSLNTRPVGDGPVPNLERMHSGPPLAPFGVPAEEALKVVADEKVVHSVGYC